MIILSNRLQAIADQVPAGCSMADIGSDHALLPAYLAEQGMIRRAVAGEVNTGPYAAALRQVEAAGLHNMVEVRKGDGLAVIQAGEVEVITIAGMGGALIVRILSEGAAKLQGVKLLVLQPNVGEELVRRWLFENGWFLAKEAILEEEGKIYEVLTAVARPDAEKRNRELYGGRNLAGLVWDKQGLMSMGPYLSAEASPVFVKKWEGELEKLERIASELEKSSLSSAAGKRRELLEEIDRIRRVLECLQTDKP